MAQRFPGVEAAGEVGDVSKVGAAEDAGGDGAAVSAFAGCPILSPGFGEGWDSNAVLVLPPCRSNGERQEPALSEVEGMAQTHFL